MLTLRSLFAAAVLAMAGHHVLVKAEMVIDAPSAFPSEALPSVTPSSEPSSKPSEQGPEIVAFHVVNIDDLSLANMGRVKSDDKKPGKINFDWNGKIRANKVQLEIEPEIGALSVEIKTNGGKRFCVDLADRARPAAFNNGDINIPYPLEYGFHKIKATAYLDSDCKSGKGPTSILKLKVRFGDNVPQKGAVMCTEPFVVGLQYTDGSGMKQDLVPGPGVLSCISETANPNLEAFVVACMLEDFTIVPVGRVRFRLENLNSPESYKEVINDGEGPTFGGKFTLSTSTRYRIKATSNLKGLPKNKVNLKKRFLTDISGCEQK